MNPVIIGDATLYLGSCESILPTLGKVDAVITSPPYNFGGFHRTSLSRGLRNVRILAYESCSDDLSKDDYREFVREVLTACFDISREGASCWWNYKGTYKDMVYSPPHWVVEVSPYSLRQDIIWHYPSGPDVGLDKFMPRVEHVFWFAKGKPYMNPEMARLGNVWSITQHNGLSGHPAAFPVELPIRCIRASTKRGEAILDPFMGSGTTGVAAIQLGRRFIGIEREPKYFDIACRRIEEAAKQGQLFEPTPAKQEQTKFF